MSVPVVIALGGNLGDVRSTGEQALRNLNAIPGLSVEQVSAWYSTEPVGCEGRFLNAAARLTSELHPSALLAQLHEVEARHGRVRAGHWTPRPIDLDLVQFGDWRINHPQLHVPHPAAWYRRFVLDPVCEVAGQWTCPEWGLTYEKLRDRLRLRPLPVLWGGDLGDLDAIRKGIPRPFQTQVEWVAPGNAAVATFVTGPRNGVSPFEIPLPLSHAEALRVVNETLTAMLDEPHAVSLSEWPENSESCDAPFARAKQLPGD